MINLAIKLLWTNPVDLAHPDANRVSEHPLPIGVVLGVANIEDVVTSTDGALANNANKLPAYAGVGLNTQAKTLEELNIAKRTLTSITYATYAAQMANTQSLIDGQSCSVLSYYEPGDGGYIPMHWDSSSTATHNGGTIRQPTSVTGAGRWHADTTSFVNVKQFGAVANGTTDDSVFVQAALATGATVWIPPILNVALSNPSTITTANQKLIVDGTITSTVATNKVIIVSAPDVTISGKGKINSPAIFDGTNANPTYAIIWVTHQGFVLNGLTFNNIPRVGVKLEDATRANIRNCFAYGNFPLADFDDVGATTTVHNFVNVNPPPTGTAYDSCVVINNYMEGFITGVGEGNYGAANLEAGLQVIGNKFVRCLDHGIYLRKANGSVIQGNNFYNCYAPIVADGIGSVVTNNTLYEDGTFLNRRTQTISLRSAKNCIVSGNTIYGKGAAIDCSYVTDNPDIMYNIITANTVIQTEADNTRTPFCIRLASTLGNVTGNKVTSNIVKTMGTNVLNAGIVINGNATYTAEWNTVTDNDITVAGSIFGIAETLGNNNDISRNRVDFEYDSDVAVTLSGLYISGGNTSAMGNQINYTSGGTNVTFRGIQIASGNTGEFYDNRFNLTSASLVSAVKYFNSAETTNFVRSKKYIERVAVPASGTWNVGDIVYNSAPTAGGYMGWVYTTTGWKTWGQISA